MGRYLETFFRHRIILLAPIVVALIATVGITMGQPRVYQASATVWFDGSVSPFDYLNSTQPYTAPADLQQTVLLELLTTRTFSHQVGYEGPLAAYLAQRPDAYDNALGLNELEVHYLGSQVVSPSGDAMDSLLADTVAKRTGVIRIGPQVLSITFDAPDPTVAAGTVSAIVKVFFAQAQATQLAQAQAAVDFYQQQLSQLPKPKPTDDVAKAQLANLQDKLDQAQLQLAAVKQPGTQGYRVLDPAIVPTQPKSFRKQLAIAGGAGLGLGAAIAFLLLLLLTWSDRTLRAPQDARILLGRTLVGTIPLVRDRS